MTWPRFVRERQDGFELRLDEGERDLLEASIGQLRTLLVNENPSSDPGVARLFPPAYPEDALQNLDFERGVGDRLLADRLAALDTVERSLDGPRLTEEQLSALMRVVNDIRLVYGVRLDITEDSTMADFPQDPQRGAYLRYRWLSDLLDDTVRALVRS